MDVKAPAKEIADLIVKGEYDYRIELTKNGLVKINIGIIIPEDHQPKRTLEGRRERFRNCLTELLEPYGWVKIKPNYYQKREQTQ